ncbi:hypothetical protein TWF730_009286 [Orbilia blumenaviensis]|uniref:Uncharacterized protein n=1 Tax=Orbilia blumenaviensis TaxID=1796055 RepID=A0AAV9V0Y3_9PEZI
MMDADETPITVRTVNRSWVIRNPDRINTNNHNHSELPTELQAIEEAIDRQEYYRRLTETWYDIWKPVLQRMQFEAKGVTIPDAPALDRGQEVILSPSICRLLKSAADGGVLLQRVPTNLEEDLRELVLPLIDPFLRVQPGSTSRKQYFVRLNDCSPKDGIGSQGPFSEPWPIIVSLCTSSRTQKALRDLLECGVYRDKDINEDRPTAHQVLHLIPWREEISTLNEFRIFVPPNGNIRAISQYSERSGGWADDVSANYDKIKRLVPAMIECNTKFRLLVQEAGLELPKGGYVLDVHAQLLQQENGGSASQQGPIWSVEPIEINPFGAQLAAGSGIFQWLIDWEFMYGFSDSLIVALVYDDCREDESE